MLLPVFVFVFGAVSQDGEPVFQTLGLSAESRKTDAQDCEVLFSRPPAYYFKLSLACFDPGQVQSVSAYCMLLISMTAQVARASVLHFWLPSSCYSSSAQAKHVLAPKSGGPVFARPPRQKHLPILYICFEARDPRNLGRLQFQNT